MSHCPSPHKPFHGLPRQPSGDPTASARRPSAGRLVGSPDMLWLGATFWFADLQVEKQLVRVSEDVMRSHVQATLFVCLLACLLVCLWGGPGGK